jgi:hypothetical protein
MHGRLQLGVYKRRKTMGYMGERRQVEKPCLLTITFQKRTGRREEGKWKKVN